DAGAPPVQPTYTLGSYLSAATNEVIAVYRPNQDINNLDPVTQKALLDAASHDGGGGGALSPLYFGLSLPPSASGPSPGYGYSTGQVPPVAQTLTSYGALNVPPSLNPLGLKFSPVNAPNEHLFDTT